MSESNLPEWEQLLSAAAHLQEILPDATLVGGTAVAIFAQHRLSRDADHVPPNLRGRFDEVLARNGLDRRELRKHLLRWITSTRKPAANQPCSSCKFS